MDRRSYFQIGGRSRSKQFLRFQSLAEKCGQICRLEIYNQFSAPPAPFKPLGGSL